MSKPQFQGSITQFLSLSIAIPCFSFIFSAISLLAPIHENDTAASILIRCVLSTMISPLLTLLSKTEVTELMLKP